MLERTLLTVGFIAAVASGGCSIAFLIGLSGADIFSVAITFLAIWYASMLALGVNVILELWRTSR